MKKILLYFFTIILLSNCLTVHLHASENTAQETTIQLEDGSYYIITIEDMTLAKASTKTGTKTSRYYSSDDVLLWSVTVKGIFSYTGSTSSCTSSSVSTTCPDGSWKITSKSSGKSGAKASATATAKRYVAGVAVQTVTRTVTLTCSATGTLS